MSLQATKILEIMDVFPKYLNKQYVSANMPEAGNEYGKAYNLHEPNFAKLGDKQLVENMLPELIKIPIHQELGIMTSEHQLEISVPMLGFTDLLKNDVLHIADLQFAAPVFINGFGAGNSVAHPDFILATDIMGNQFEILVSGDGLIEIPAEGLGLFSVLSYLTFIYSEWQIKQGKGLEDLSAEGIEPGYLYLLPPIAEKTFIPKIALTHLDENNMRKVDTLHSVEVEMKAPHNQIDLSSDVHALDDRHDTFEILMNIKNHDVSSSPFSVKFTLMNADDTHFSLHSPSNPFHGLSSQGWQQSIVEDNTFVKHFGLNDETKTVIFRNVYSELDFTKDFLLGDNFGLSTAKNYNNFMIHPEGLGKIYDLVTDGVVHNHISSDFLWDRVSDSTLADLDLQHIPLAFHDSVILSDILSDSQIDTAQAIKQFFGDHSDQAISESLSVYASKAQAALPTLSVEVIDAHQHDDMGTGSISFVTVNDNIEHALSQSFSHQASQPSDGLSLHIADTNNEKGLDLHFSDIIQTADSGTLSALTSAPQDLTALLNTSETAYTSETMNFMDVHYSSPDANMMGELHMMFTQNPVDI